MGKVYKIISTWIRCNNVSDGKIRLVSLSLYYIILQYDMLLCYVCYNVRGKDHRDVPFPLTSIDIFLKTITTAYSRTVVFSCTTD